MAYITLSTLKLALGINTSDTTRDSLLTQAISAAEKAVDDNTGRGVPAFNKDASASARTYRTVGRVASDIDGEVLLVDDIADTAGLIVEVGDGTTWTTLAAGDYDLEPDNAIARGRPVTEIRYIDDCWSAYRRARITAIWGWPAVPGPIVQATLLQASRLYRRKDTPEGVAGSAEWGQIRVSRVDPDVAAMIAPYRLAGVA